MAPVASSAVARDRALREATADAKPTAVMSASRVRCHERSADASGIAPRGDLVAGGGVRDRRRLALLVIRVGYGMRPYEDQSQSPRRHHRDDRRELRGGRRRVVCRCGRRTRTHETSSRQRRVRSDQGLPARQPCAGPTGHATLVALQLLRFPHLPTGTHPRHPRQPRRVRNDPLARPDAVRAVRFKHLHVTGRQTLQTRGTSPRGCSHDRRHRIR